MKRKRKEKKEKRKSRKKEIPGDRPRPFNYILLAVKASSAFAQYSLVVSEGIEAKKINKKMNKKEGGGRKSRERKVKKVFEIHYTFIFLFSFHFFFFLFSSFFLLSFLFSLSLSIASFFSPFFFFKKNIYIYKS